MKNRVMITALLIASLVAFSLVPRANADPLTIMAIVGVATVLSLSTIDMAASDHEEDNKDMRAQQEAIKKTHAKAETIGEAPSSTQVAITPHHIW